MDKIFIRGLAAEAKIGIFDWERNIRQLVLVDVEIMADTANAARTDSILNTFDYAEISKGLLFHIENSECFLIETLAEELADLIIRKFEVTWLKLCLRKTGAISEASEVGVEIERRKPS